MAEIEVTTIDKVAIVAINKPKKFNSLSWANFNQIKKGLMSTETLLFQVENILVSVVGWLLEHKWENYLRSNRLGDILGFKVFQNE